MYVQDEVGFKLFRCLILNGRLHVLISVVPQSTDSNTALQINITATENGEK